MPVIKVWCLPKSEEEKLNELHQSIVRAVASVEELGVKDEVEVTGLFDKPERTDEIRQRLAEQIGKAVKGQFPDTELKDITCLFPPDMMQYGLGTEIIIECFVYPFQVSKGFWSSRETAPNPYRAYRQLERLLPKTGS